MGNMARRNCEIILKIEEGHLEKLGKEGKQGTDKDCHQEKLYPDGMNLVFSLLLFERHKVFGIGKNGLIH